ncbi:hypothetical protein F5884DRAFT_756061 [Xylogone sp. PMI_703]|nr:hypothetical protein F5884DRAFT_756061 [Xylogone sp. PMI_703]
MSDISSPTSPPPDSKKPAKRPRNDESQRERKRELDRRAQRNSREKQRLYIARLERTIEILQKDNGKSATTELMGEIQQLRHANDHLCGVIERIRGALAISTCEPPLLPPNEVPSPNQDRIKEVGLTSDEPGVEPEAEAEVEIWPPAPFDSAQPWPEFKTGVQSRPQSYFSGDCRATTNASSISGPDYTNSFMLGSEVDWARSNVDRALTFISPLATNMPILKPPDAPYDILWQRSNDIYGQVFKVPPELANPASLLPSRYYGGAICKAVMKGWEFLSIQEKGNPILQILRDIAEQFANLDPISKIAFMYKSHSLLKYYLKPDKTVWDEIPAWQRPMYDPNLDVGVMSHSQTSREHDIALDFFCWPALRERLLDTPHTYFHQHDFSVNFARYYKFKWPFSAEQSFIYHKDTDTYELSPLFEQYHRDLQFWTIETPFFQRFPELSRDVSDLQAKADPLFPTYQQWMSADSSKADRMMSSGMLDSSIMQLFDDFPPMA